MRYPLPPAWIPVIKYGWCPRRHIVGSFLITRADTTSQQFTMKFIPMDHVVHLQRETQLAIPTFDATKLKRNNKIKPTWNQIKVEWNETTSQESYLTTKRTESESINKAPPTNLTVVGDAFSWPSLRTLVQEHDLGAVDNVCLNAWYV